MKRILLMVFLLALPAVTEQKMLPLNLNGNPFNNSEITKSMDLYIESETDWELSVLGKDLQTIQNDRTYLLPIERISIKVDDGNWIQLENSKKICSGHGPCYVTLEYKFTPTWEDKFTAQEYAGELNYVLTSGKIYSSSFKPRIVAQGETASLIFSDLNLPCAKIKILKEHVEVIELEVFNTNKCWIETKDQNGTLWEEGDYCYEVFSQGALITKGIFEVKRDHYLGELRGRLKFTEPFFGERLYLEIYDIKNNLVSRREGEEALNYQLGLLEGSYYLKAGSKNTSQVEPFSIKAGQLLEKDIILRSDSELELAVEVLPKTINQGSKGRLEIEIQNLGGEDLSELSVAVRLPAGLVYTQSDSLYLNKQLATLKSCSKLKLTEEFIALPSYNRTLFPSGEVEIKAKTNQNVILEKKAVFTVEVKPSLFSEPGILVGESSTGFYFADGTFIQPEADYFCLQLEPGSYGLLLGFKPYVLNVSGLSERVKLPNTTGKKAGLLELQAVINSKPNFAIKGFYASKNLKLAFAYPDYQLKQPDVLTPYPKWGTENKIIAKTPWQFSYTTREGSFNAGTVYLSPPLGRGFLPQALVGLDAELKAKNGVHLKTTGGFFLEGKKQEEFLADGTTGPFTLGAKPKEGSVNLTVEARDKNGHVIKSFSWDYYLDREDLKLKRPLSAKDQLGLTNYLVVSYISESATSNDIFIGGHLGYTDNKNSLYLFRNSDDEGMVGRLNYKKWSLEGVAGKNLREVIISRKTPATRQDIKVKNSQETSYSYRLDYTGNWYGSFNLLFNQVNSSLNKAELNFNFKNDLIKVWLTQRLNLQKGLEEINNQYYLYSTALNWPKNLVWGVSKEGFANKTVTTFSNRMLYKLAGFSGYLEGSWRKGDQEKPRLAVSLKHEKIPFSLKAEWEHIEPQFFLLEACYDTKLFWANISLCQERNSLKKALGLTVLPKDSLIFLAVKDEVIKTQIHLPWSKTKFSLSFTGDQKSKLTVSEVEVDLRLSQNSQVGIKGINKKTLKNNFRLQGFYRYQMDSLQLEMRLDERESGLYLTYLIPLGQAQADITSKPAFISREDD